MYSVTKDRFVTTGTYTCKDCEFCKLLYIPPAKCFDEVTKACGGTKNSYICSAFEEEANRVQFLGDNTGFCEIFTLKQDKN